MSPSASSPPETAETVLDVEPGAAELLKLLADGTRRRIFLIVMRGEVCNCELASALDLPQNLVSHHLHRLRQGGLLEEHRDPHDGRWIHYTVDVGGLASAWQALSVALDPANIGDRLPVCQRQSPSSLATLTVGRGR